MSLLTTSINIPLRCYKRRPQRLNNNIGSVRPIIQPYSKVQEKNPKRVSGSFAVAVLGWGQGAQPPCPNLAQAPQIFFRVKQKVW